MHDIDRVRLETQYDFETPALQAEQFEYPEYEGSGQVFGETDNMELASQMLEITNEQELDHFIGDLISKAGHALGSIIKSPEGKALAGLLKGAAKKVLPALGSAAGKFLGGESGADVGRRAAEAAGRAFGLELEGLSGEDREFEIARRYVDLAGEAVKNTVAAPAGPNPRSAASAAFQAAAQTHAPGLLGAKPVPAAQPAAAAAQEPAPGDHRHGGRWIRHGNTIVLYGV